MKKASEEKKTHTEHENCSKPTPTSRELAIQARKAGEAFIALAEELQKTSEYDQNNTEVDHRKMENVGGVPTYFYQDGEKLLSEFGSIERKILRLLEKFEKTEKK